MNFIREKRSCLSINGTLYYMLLFLERNVYNCNNYVAKLEFSGADNSMVKRYFLGPKPAIEMESMVDILKVMELKDE